MVNDRPCNTPANMGQARALLTSHRHTDGQTLDLFILGDSDPNDYCSP